MSLSSRLVAKLFWLGCFTIFVFGSQLVNGDAKTAMAEVSVNRLRSFVGETECFPTCDRSNFELVGCWLKFTYPGIEARLHSINEAIEVVPQALQTFTDSQEARLKEILIGSVGAVTREQGILVAWALNGFNGGDAELDSSVLSENDQPSPYWVYYQDCDRWGVNLTRTIEHAYPTIAVADTRPLSEPLKHHGTIPDNRDLKRSTIQLLSNTMDYASRWLKQALRQLEFVTIESHVSSNSNSTEQRQTTLP